MGTLEQIKSDPFIPKEICELVTDLLKNRFDVMFSIHMEFFRDYGNKLASQVIQPANINYCYGVHNKINTALYERGCGISQIQEEVHEIRKAIQQYFESFDPR